MQTCVRGRSLLGGLAVVILAVLLPLEGCSNTSNSSGLDGGDSDGGSAPNLGASYSCSATSTSATCVVGQSYCEVSKGGAGGTPGSNTGLYTTAICRTIPQGTVCAANPTCACVCAAVFCYSSDMCSDTDGFVTLTRLVP